MLSLIHLPHANSPAMARALGSNPEPRATAHGFSLNPTVLGSLETPSSFKSSLVGELHYPAAPAPCNQLPTRRRRSSTLLNVTGYGLFVCCVFRRELFFSDIKTNTHRAPTQTAPREKAAPYRILVQLKKQQRPRRLILSF